MNHEFVVSASESPTELRVQREEIDGLSSLPMEKCGVQNKMGHAAATEVTRSHLMSPDAEFAEYSKLRHAFLRIH